MRSDRRELDPVSPAMLGCARRDWDDIPDIFVLSTTHWIPAFAGITGYDCVQYPKTGHKESTPALQLEGLDARPAQPSIAAGLGLSEPPCLSWICKPQGAANPASSASAQTGEKRRNPRKRASLRDAFLLATFLWRSKEK
jgi:hypothetical protein